MVSPAFICPVSDIDILITDDGISKNASLAFTRSGVRVMSV
jgi:DeoR/GlpR family transcriptional regulator of sugar metabolism